MADTTTRSSERDDRGDRTASRALDVDLDADLHRVNPDAYFEDESWIPEPLHQYGNLDTSDTGGAAHNDIRTISPVFDMARATNLRQAVRALDPDDPTVGEEMVTLPQGSVTVMGTTRTADDGRADIESAYNRLVEEPILLGGATGPHALAAGEEDEALLRSREDADGGSGRSSSSSRSTRDDAATVDDGTGAKPTQSRSTSSSGGSSRSTSARK